MSGSQDYSTMYPIQMDQEADELANKNLLNKIASVLKDIEGNSPKKSTENFCIEETFTPDDIKVVVKGVGKLSFPLRKVYVQRLINVSTTAKSGMGENIELSKNVHNPQMIESKILNVTINQESLSRITNHMQKALNLPANSALTPHLHNMLIYGPGEYSNKHCDSEKLQDMVAVLVIILPSPHVGGDMIIEYGRNKHIFSTENVDEENAKCVCFYSDSLHKINKVKCGHRIAVTFNIFIEPGELVNPECTNQELKGAVRDYFNNTVVKDRSEKIVFFLNHTYSEYTLRWNLLKGEDRLYASNLRAVAQELALDIHLVLANIRPSWSSVSGYHSTVNFWIDTSNSILPYGEYSTTISEICYTQNTSSRNFISSRSTNTDSYKHAAVVLWRNSDLVKIKFELNYEKAITELSALISIPGNEKKVTDILDKTIELLHKDRPRINNFETFVNISLYVKAKKKALVILSAFCLNVLIPKNVQILVQLQQQYGIDWLIELFGALRCEKRYDYSSDSSMGSEVINPFLCEFLSSGGDKSVMEFLLKEEVTSFIEKSAKWNTFFHFGKTKDREKPQQLFKACEAIGNVSLQQKLAQYLTSQPKLYSRKELVKLYFQLEKTLRPESSENFEPLRAYLVEAVKQELCSQVRNVDDWSISAPLSCTCQHCNILLKFLCSKTDTRKSCHANRNICKHIISKLKSSKAPVDITVRREKNLFTIMLKKNTMLREEAERQCTELKTILETLESKVAVNRRHQSLMENDDKKLERH